MFAVLLAVPVRIPISIPSGVLLGVLSGVPLAVLEGFIAIRVSGDANVVAL